MGHLKKSSSGHLLRTPSAHLTISCGCTKTLRITGTGTPLPFVVSGPTTLCPAGSNCPPITGDYAAADCDSAAVNASFVIYHCTHGGNDYYYWISIVDTPDAITTGKGSILMYSSTFFVSAGSPPPSPTPATSGGGSTAFSQDRNIDYEIVSGSITVTSDTSTTTPTRNCCVIESYGVSFV